MDIQARTVDGTHYVALNGDLDLEGAGRVFGMLVGIAGSTVVVDLGGLRFIDATGVSALMAARDRMADDDNRLVLRGAQPQVRRVFRLLGLLDVIE